MARKANLKDNVLNKLDIESFYRSHLELNCEPNQGGNVMALCPFHDDVKPSLSIKLDTGQFKCFGCKESGSAIDFYRLIQGNGMDFKTALMDLARDTGVLEKDGELGNIKETYGYKDHHDDIVHQTVRFENKKFRQRRPDGEGGWVWDLKGIDIVPYRLLEFMNKKAIFIVEGEKDANNLQRILVQRIPY